MPKSCGVQSFAQVTVINGQHFYNVSAGSITEDPYAADYPLLSRNDTESTEPPYVQAVVVINGADALFPPCG
jgi:hypothetical protein